MKAEIISVGTELLLGDIVNTNSQFLSRELAAYGIEVLHQSTVGDNTARLSKELAEALSRSDLVFLTGGLGPTQDDLTKETVCEQLNLPLTLHEPSLARIEEYFRTTGREMTDNNRKQAMLPDGCTVFPNDHGTAPGCAVERYEQSILMLPGPPRELIPMFNDYVAPYLAKYAGGTIFSHTIGVFGMSESTLAERIADLMSEANPTVAPYAKDGEVVLRVTARAADTDAAKALCAPVVEEICKRLGSYVYGVDAGSLQKTVVGRLRDSGLKIATAESCTAGLLSSRITEVPGASAVFECGVAAYSGDIKHEVLGVSQKLIDRCGTVSPEVASAMAVGARRLAHAALGVAITGVAGPDEIEGKPVGTVYIALADEKRVWVKKIVAGHGASDRDYVRYIAASHALDLTRRYLEALPAVMAGGELLAGAPYEKAHIPHTPVTGQKRPLAAAVFPWKGDGRAEIVRKTGILIALLLLLAAIIWGMVSWLVPLRDQGLYDQLRHNYMQGTTVSGGRAPDDSPEGMLAQFYTLFENNRDVRGWLSIDDTTISYPVVQSDRRNPHYYEQHNFRGQISHYGTPYFDSRAVFYSADSINRNLVIYGNNTHDGQMFSELMKYQDIEFLRRHPVVEMNTIFHNGTWKVFAVFYVGTAERTSATNFAYTRSDFADEEAFHSFVKEVRRRSIFTVPEVTVDIRDGDNLLMLSTNAEWEAGFDGARLVVAARQVRDGEDKTVDLADARENNGALMPQEWRRPSSGAGAVSTAPHRTTTAASTTIGETATSGEMAVPPGNPTTVTTDVLDGLETYTSAHTERTTTTSRTSRPTSTTSKVTTTTATQIQPTEPTKEPDTEKPYEPVLRKSTVPEETFLAMFRYKDGEAVKSPGSKEDLQMALARLVKGEMGSAKLYETSVAAIQAQAVAGYTYGLYTAAKAQEDTQLIRISKSIDLSNDADQKIYQAVGDVAGIKLLDTSQKTAETMPCYAAYHALSAGYTTDNRKVFGADMPYLRSVVSRYDNEAYMFRTFGVHAEQTVEYATSGDVLEAIRKSFSAKDPPETIDEIVCVEQAGKTAVYVTETDGAGAHPYVLKTNIRFKRGATVSFVTGRQLRAAIEQPLGSVLSHSFDVRDAADGKLAFTFYGQGHGVGMSQYGAAAYAREEKWNYKQILAHYYSITATSAWQLVEPKW